MTEPDPREQLARAKAKAEAFLEARELAEAMAAPPSLIEYLSSRITVCQATQRYAATQIAQERQGRCQ